MIFFLKRTLEYFCIALYSRYSLVAVCRPHLVNSAGADPQLKAQKENSADGKSRLLEINDTGQLFNEHFRSQFSY